MYLHFQQQQRGRSAAQNQGHRPLGAAHNISKEGTCQQISLAR